MRSVRLRRVLAATVFAAVRLAPTAAMANGWVLERGLLGGLFANTVWAAPDVSGHWAVYLSRNTVAIPSLYALSKVDLRTGVSSVVAADVTDGIESPAVDGDWVAYAVGGDIRVENLVTGAVKKVTDDGATTAESDPVVSGKYVVWESDSGSDSDIWGKDFTGTHAKFLIAGGAGNQIQPSIHGAHVAYRDESAGDTQGQIMLKTIGSSAAAVNLTNNTDDQFLPSIGDHLVAWLALNTSGRAMVRYHNFDTGENLSGPSDPDYSIANPQVSGDRILYDIPSGSNRDMYVFDVRAWRASGGGIPLSFAMPNTNQDELEGKISGNACVYLSNGSPTWARLAVPGLSIGSVPTRVPHHGHIHLKGTLTDQSVPIGYAPLRVEKYSGGKWVKVKTITTSASGAYSYQTPTLHSKTNYRVAYDGRAAVAFNPGIARHFSAVSAVRTGWPR
jgi:hypothetical protein